MPKLPHEIWRDDSGEGIGQSFFVASGPGVEQHRRLLPPDAKLIATIWASSYLEALIQYNRFMGWEEYKPFIDPETGEVMGAEPYPEEWATG